MWYEKFNIMQIIMDNIGDFKWNFNLRIIHSLFFIKFTKSSKIRGKHCFEMLLEI